MQRALSVMLTCGLALLAVALRYRSLTSLFLVLVMIERSLMALHGWVLSPPASGHHPPQHYGSVAAVVLGALFLTLSLRTRPGPERYSR